MNKVNVERWLDVPGWEALYQVSDQGRVKSLIPYRGSTSRIRQSWAPTNGYSIMGLYAGAVKVSIRVHRLVAEAFLGPCPPTCQVNHKNGIKGDNRLVNLEYVTPKQNTSHAINVLGLDWGSGRRGRPSGYRRLSAEQAKLVRMLYKSGGHTWRSLGRQFGVSHATIGKLLRRERYREM